MRVERACLFLVLLMATATVRAETKDYVLAPAPREITYHQGDCRLAAGSHVWADLSGATDLRPVAEQVRATLGELYGGLQLAAADGANTSVEIRVLPDRVSRAQGYELVILPEKIRLTAHDTAGAFYAAQTLKQMCRVAEGKLRCLKISDWPDFPNRGVMLDISRDKVPTMETLYQLVDMLAEFKVNQFQLYTEHTFAYRNHETVWKDASPMTAEQILLLDRYCRERHIELVPNQASFGHLNRWLKHEPYRRLAEAPDGCQTDWGWLQGHSLCATDPAAVTFLAELYDELLPNFSSRQFNVACDETVDLGCGRTKEICEKKGKGRVYLDFVKEIHRLVSARGRTMQMWGDIVMKHPELIGELPKDVIVLEWGYDADHPFDANCRKYAAAGVPFYVCPGISTWRTVAGRTSNAMANLLSAAENGIKHGAIGFLNTDWGDFGHTHPLAVCYPGYAYGAAVSWSVDANRNLDVPAVLDRHVFRDRAGLAGKLVCDLGDAYKVPGVEIRNASVLFYILIKPEENFNRGPYGKLTKESLAKTLDYLDRVMAPLGKSNMEVRDAGLIKDDLTCAANLLRHACRLGIARIDAPEKKIENIPEARRAVLAAELKQILDEYQRLWLLRNRPGGLADSVSVFAPLLKLYQAAVPPSSPAPGQPPNAGNALPANGFVWPSDIPADCPFPRSATLTGVLFTGRHGDYHCGDTIYPSWAGDGSLYTPWTDGKTDGITCTSGGSLKNGFKTGHAVLIGENPLDLTIRNTSPPKRGLAAPYRGRYPCGSLVYNGIWYYGTYCLGPSAGYEHEGFEWNWPNLGPMPGFQISRDLGKTWEPSPLSPEKPLFPEPAEFLGPVKMGAPHFVDFGKNMEHSPDGKAYVIGMGAEANDPMPRPCIKAGALGKAFEANEKCDDAIHLQMRGEEAANPDLKDIYERAFKQAEGKPFAHANLSWISADQAYLARVTPSPETINDIKAYEFFAGHDAAGKPLWSNDLAKIKPLLEWNNHMGCVTATYVPGLKKYLMCVTDGWPTVAKMNSYILEADVITGPWRMVAYLKDFGEQAYFLNFPGKFISPDGKTLWLCYSANFSQGVNGVELKFNPPGGRYGLSLHEIRLVEAKNRFHHRP